MKMKIILFSFLIVLFLPACNQQTIEDPANPKVNREYDRSADIKGIIIKVDENKAQLLIQGHGFGLNEDGEGMIQLDTQYYSINNFEKDQTIEIWVDNQTQVDEKHHIPIISDSAKINFTPKKQSDN